MKSDGVEANFNSLVNGLRDAIDGRDPQLGVEEMKRLIVDVKKRAREAELRKVQETIVRNAEESTKFLDENGKKPGIKTTSSGLQYQVLKAGGGPIPKGDDVVRVHYRGTFINGKEFDSSYAKGEPETFRADGVIKGWAEALQMMTVGSKWQLFVPPDLAYGRGGLGQKIPPNSVLVFEIELLAIELAQKESKG
jgi:FKBP-type peptidyl-prolyl cis-trans isomerase